MYAASALYLLTCVLVLISEVMGGEPFLRLDKLLIAGILLLLLVGAVTITFNQVGSLRAVRQSRNLSED